MITVEIWSDVVCPWCAVGKRRFETALAESPHADDVEVRWRSFELDPRAPTTRDGDYVEMLAAKYRTSTDQAQSMVDRMVAAGAADGIEFRFDIAKPGNTFDAHRLIHLADAHGLQHEMKDRLLRAYHSEGEAIAGHATLTRLAGEVGLDGDEAVVVLAGDRFAVEVRADEQEARDLGISGVPFFVIDRKLGISGAQPAEVLREAIARAADDGATATA